MGVLNRGLDAVRRYIKQVEITYPEIDFKISRAAELPVSDLECDSHLIIFVELFVETLSRVCSEVDVVGESGAE